MTAPFLPGFEARCTYDYYARVPHKAIRPGGLTGAKSHLFSYLSDRSRGGELPVAARVADIARDLELHPSSVRRMLAELERDHPPGVDHGYIQRVGPPSDWRIIVLYRPLRGPSDESPTARASARKSMDAARAGARAPFPKSRPNPKVAATPLFERIEEKNNVDVIPSSGNRPACAREARPATVPLPATVPAVPPVAAPPRPAAAPSPSPQDRSAAGVMKRFLDVAERLKEREAQEAVRAIESGATGPQTPEVVAARQMTAPAPAPSRPSPHVETPDLIRRLATPAGPELVDQVVGRLCERVDPEFEPLFRRRCSQAADGKLDVGVLIGAFHWSRGAKGHGVKPGPAFAAYLRERLEQDAEKRRRIQRRRE